MEMERYYTAETYLLPSDEVERARLQEQHEMLKTRHSGRLLPAGFKARDGDKILDAATGTGAWAVDVAKILPEGTTIIGTDICDRLFPAATPTMYFEVHSTLSLPSFWSSTFALAHQRLLIGAFSASAWQQTISELNRVIKPGGWVHLEELDVTRVASADLGPVPPLSAKFLNAFGGLCRERNVAPETVGRVSKLLMEVGFVDLKMTSIIVNTGGEEGKDVRGPWAGAWRGMEGPILQLGGGGMASTPAEYRAFMDSVEEEWEREP
ncbi:S-adenosyl-L-methionine-dependent methyltransferase, partial [Calocera cornea HHB12733]